MKRAIVLVLGYAVLVPACSWASFDNLAGETWVDSSGPPKGSDTTKFGANLAAGGARPAAGGMQMLVLGRANPDVSRLAYDGNGIITQADGGDILTTLQFTKFDDLHPATAGDPGTNVVAFSLVTRGGATSMDKDANTKVVFYGSDSDGPKLLRQHEPGPDLKEAKVASGIAFGEVDGDSTHPDLLIARDDQVMIMTDAEDDETASTMFRITACTHAEPTSFAIGLGEFDSSSAGPEVVLSTGSPIGELNPGPSYIKIFSPAAVLAYTGGPVGQCFGGTTGFSAKLIDKSSENVIDLGEQLVVTNFGTAAAPLPAIVASAPKENKLFVFTGDLGTAASLDEIDIPAPTGAGALGSSLAVGDLDGDGIPELAVGDPKATSSDGVQAAGSVFVYKWNGTGFDLKATLRDASPDIEQHFGTSVSIVPFGTGTSNVLVAGSDNEVFTYFRLDPLYKDVRAGHQ